MCFPWSDKICNENVPAQEDAKPGATASTSFALGLFGQVGACIVYWSVDGNRHISALRCSRLKTHLYI